MEVFYYILWAEDSAMARPLLLDGAMGTELINRGVDLPLPIWSADANINNKETVHSIHMDYVQAGADILTTNTFRTTTYTYRKAGYSTEKAKTRARDSLLAAVEVARSAAGDIGKVAGSITSVEDCYNPELFPGKGAAEDTYGEMLEWFTEGEVDLLLFETMGNREEIEIGLSLAGETSIETWISLILKDGKHLLDGTPLISFLEMVESSHAACLLFNCNQIETTEQALETITIKWNSDWGLYPNLGITDFDNDYFDIINESIFIERFDRFLELKPSVIGACCGSTPEHIQLLKEMIEKK